MAIYAKKPKSTFDPCPEGLWPGVCIDVVDKGMVATDYGPKHKIQIRWVADAEPRRADKKPYMVTGKFNLSMGKKSKLRPALELWRGRPFTDDQAFNFDIETLIGAPCQLQVAQKQGDDGPYAFVQVVLKATNGHRVSVPTDYVRECKRPGYQAPDVPEEIEEAPADFDQSISDEDIPF